MAHPLTLDNAAGRNLLFALSGLAGPRSPRRPLGEIIEQLGYVQLDSIRIVERAQHHILHARQESYRPRHLTRLYGPAPIAFEHWTHDTSLIALGFYPHWRHRFAAARKTLPSRDHWKTRLGDRSVLKSMRTHLEKAGPTKARDHETRQGERGAWWDWAPHKAALEFLWLTGEVAIAGRDGFEKIYDLTERVIPQHVRDERPSHAHTIDWACREALARLGAGTAAEIQDFFSLVSRADVDAWLKRAQGTGAVIPVSIAAADGAKAWTAYALPDLEGKLPGLTAPPNRLRVLSPFDPLIRDRKRLARLFGFDYTIEIFVPAPKRKYGYYVFPLLDGDRFVGRAEIRADRNADELRLERIWWEPGSKPSKGRLRRLDAELQRLARLTGVSRVVQAEGD